MFTSGEDLAYSCKSLTLDLNAASHWAKVWGMLYNAEKSQHLTVRSKHVRVSSPPISMGGVTVPQVDHHKHLGVHLNKSLTWTDHVNEVFSTCARRIGMLRRLRRILPNAAIRRIYVGSIRPILEYTCPVWCGGPIAKLVKLQESFCRRHHVTLPPVKKRFDYHTLILFYKTKAGPPPPLEAILVIFGRRALFFFLFERSWKKMKNNTTFVRMRSGDHLGDAKMSKKGTSLRRI